MKKNDACRKSSRKCKVGVCKTRKSGHLGSGRAELRKPVHHTHITGRNHKHAVHKSKKRSSRHCVSGRSKAVILARLKAVKKLSMSGDVLADLSINERVILFAKKMLYLPYRFGGNGATGLDCSAYVQRVFNLIGQNIPRSAREQFDIGEPVDKEYLETGDLVFFQTYAPFPSHVGIYIGNNLFIHASSRSRVVTINSLETPYYAGHYIGAKRIISEN